MSLVHEALQKAEREKRRKLGTMPSAPVSPGAPHPASTPVFHAPVATAPVVSVARPVMSHSPAAPVEEPQKTNNVLLPALIGCVAIVATIAASSRTRSAGRTCAPQRRSQEMYSIVLKRGAAAPRHHVSCSNVVPLRRA